MTRGRKPRGSEAASYNLAMPYLYRGGKSSRWNSRALIAAHWREAIGLAAVLLVAAFLRLNNLQSRADWDSDQGSEMLAIWNALHSGTIPQLGPLASTGTFHHGALYYDLMLPGAWLGGGAPTGVLIETALAGLMIVPMVWWVARSIGGPAAGLSAGLLAATSGGLVGFSTFIWNPTLIEPGAALALLGAWQAWSTRNPAWLLAAAAGTAVAMQAHITAGVIVVPMSMVLLALLWRGPAGQRRRIALWAVAAVALIVATYVPFILYEVGHDFAETRAILAFITGPGEQADHGPAYRLATSAVRILAWPLTGWPIWGGEPDRPVAIGVAGAFAGGLIWRLSATATPNRRRGGEAADDAIEASLDAADPQLRERDGTWLVAGCLGALILVMGLGISSTSEIVPQLTEQYHIVADPFVIVAAGIVLGSLWRLGARRRWIGAFGRLLGIAALAAAVFNSSGQWEAGPNPYSWSQAQAAASRVMRDADGRSIALIGLPDDRSTDAYGFPLVLDGATMATPDRAAVLVVLCNASFSDTCGGPMEGAWLAVQPNGSNRELLDRFTASPDRILSVYGLRSG
jgi:4-amino-4-deoxy-L-arabinose transferase-like glycosyltransferase